MKLLTIVIIIFLVVFLVEKIIEKYLGVKRKAISKTPGKSIDQWGRTIIVIIFLFSFIVALAYEVDAFLKWYFVLLLTVLMGFQTILEWKYIKESKQYISTLISSMIIISILSLLVIRF
ncbi:DUF4181 domain-containing protein [Gracilibacillus sp. Marseille-QA3620]